MARGPAHHPQEGLKVPTSMNWDDRLETADKESVAEFNACAERLAKLRVREVRHSGQLRSRAAWNLAALQQGLLYRIVALTDGIALAWNGRSIVSAFLASRALLETVSVLAELEKLTGPLLAEKDINGLDELAKKGVFAIRDSEVLEQAPEVKAKNVLTCLKNFDKQHPGAEKLYLDLSERCHPNALGHTYLFGRLDLPKETYHFSDERDPDKNGLFILAALGFLPAVEQIMSNLSLSISKISDMHETVERKSGKLLKGATGDWEMVIGMEIHAQVTSNSKLFSGASTTFGGEPNSHVSLVDAAMPGMLPVINEECVRQAVRTGLGLNAQINLRSVFDRKNYFYPDSPQGYQISQYKSPIVGEGEVVVELDGGKTAIIGIERLHLEQDAGKLLHDQSPAMSYVDLNRCGVALMEIVSKPDIRDAEQAKAYVTKLRSILRYLGTCDGDMEKGSLRADVNVSVRKPGAPLGTRCEIKNMNSITFIGQAIEYEARRQIEILEDGGEIDQETRLYDPNKGETRSMRSKEEAHDYRYFPDPDLLPLEFSQSFVDELKTELPELPDQKKARFVADFGLSAYDASVLVAERESAVFYETVLDTLGNRARDGKMAANWVINELFGRLNKEGRDITASPVNAEQLAAIIDLIGEGTISGKIAKDLFEIVWQEGGDPRALVESRGMKQVTDLSAIEKVVDDIIAANPDKAAQVKDKPQSLGWFVGQVMKASGGKANPQSVNDLLKSKLGI
ncbi:aspartyl/glutamyl-tRNA(Asn/Gln) amidotransferase B subunit [Bradyrhizobium sp. LA2.1]